MTTPSPAPLATPPAVAPAVAGRIVPAQALGLEQVLAHGGPMPLVERRMRLLDLRGPKERRDRDLRKAVRRITRRYDTPVEVRHDVLFHGRGLALFRGAVFADGAVVDGTFHKKLRETIVGDLAHVARLKGRASVLPGRHAFVQKPGSENYFHWTIECLSRFELLAPLIAAGELDGIVLAYSDAPRFVAETIDLFFPALKDKVTIVPGPLTFVEDLHFFVPGGPLVGQGAPGSDPATRMSTATAAFIDRLPRPQVPGDKVLFVPRAQMSTRKLVNEDALIAALRKDFDVDVVVGHELSVAEQIARFARAHAIVGVHGAGLTNLVHAPRGTRLVEITSLQYLNRTASFHDSSALAGGEPHLVLGDQVGDRPVVENNIGNDIVLPASGFAAIAEILARPR